MVIERKFAGDGAIDIDVNTSDGILALQGDVAYSFDVTLQLVFGVDENGFFIDTGAVAGPELTVSNLDIVGPVEAKGHFGIVEVYLTAGELVINEGVSFNVDFNDPEYDHLAEEDTGKLRLYEFNLASILGILIFEARGPPNADDLVFSGIFAVGDENGEVIPEPVVLTWNDVNRPDEIVLSGEGTTQLKNNNGEVKDGLLTGLGHMP